MADVVRVRVATNNEVAFIAWDLDGMIPGCLGFEVVRIYPDTGEERCLASWVPFQKTQTHPGQSNPRWIPQDTGVWPIQKTFWRDLTLRRKRDVVEVRPDNERVAYRVRPVGDWREGLDRVPVRPPQVVDGQPAYIGPPRPLGYLGQGATSPPVLLSQVFGKARVAFTNGVLSTQWLSHALEQRGIKVGNRPRIRAELADPKSDIRAYLAGEVPSVLMQLFDRAKTEGGSVRLALYELADDQLRDAIIDHKARVEVILSNSSKPQDGTDWDHGNAPYRKALHDKGVRVHDRMFNNNHIGHNKFAVYLDAGNVPRAVLTGSTNWTPTGVAGQSNNAFIRDDADMAAVFNDYWERMLADVIVPLPANDAPGHAVQTQGVPFRKDNHLPNPVKGATRPIAGATVWFSPNDPDHNKKTLSIVPVDLKDMFDRIADAREAVLFLVFNPSIRGEYSVVSAAVAAGKGQHKPLVTGAISADSAMPNYVAAVKDKVTKAIITPEVAPFVYPEKPWEMPNISLVRASNLTGRSLARDFQSEVLTVGNAIVHDKIVVIDPLGDRCAVITGSHNFGYKASYENDENMVIVEGDKAFAAAYAVHVLDVFDHYKFRAWRNTIVDDNKDDDGLFTDDHWLQPYVKGTKGQLAKYFP